LAVFTTAKAAVCLPLIDRAAIFALVYTGKLGLLQNFGEPFETPAGFPEVPAKSRRRKSPIITIQGRRFKTEVLKQAPL
jgi:hypothetical protein